MLVLSNGGEISDFIHPKFHCYSRCATVANAEVSSGIVGYQQVALPANGQYALLTPTFKDVGGAATIDLTDIQVVKPGESSFTSKKKVLVQKMDLTSGALTTIYQYTTAGNKWTSQTGDVVAGDVTFAAGEAMCVYNSDTAGSALAFQFSGEVELTPLSLNVPASSYTLVGNCTPVTVDLTAIAPTGANGGDLGTSKKKILVQKIIPSTGGMGTIYQYTTAGNKWTSQTGDVVAGEVTFAPGEAMCVYNGDTKTIAISFPSPISE